MRPTPNLKTTSMTASRSLEISRDRNQVCLSLRRIGRLTLTLTLTLTAAAAANSTPGHKQTKTSKVHLGSLKTFLFSLFPGNHKKIQTSFLKIILRSSEIGANVTQTPVHNFLKTFFLKGSTMWTI